MIVISSTYLVKNAFERILIIPNLAASILLVLDLVPSMKNSMLIESLRS